MITTNALVPHFETTIQDLLKQTGRNVRELVYFFHRSYPNRSMDEIAHRIAVLHNTTGRTLDSAIRETFVNLAETTYDSVMRHARQDAENNGIPIRSYFEKHFAELLKTIDE